MAMIIKAPDNHKTTWTANPIVHIVRRTNKNVIAVAFLFIVSLIATSLYSIYYGMDLYKQKIASAYDVFFENAIQTKLDIVPNFIKGRLFAKPEHVTIDVKQKHFLKLAYKREVALATQILMAGDDDFVPAQIRYQDKTVDVKIRLKGDWVDHLQGDKWSFRIVVKGDNTLFGMKQFSIHQPRVRNFIYEWIYHQAIRRENIIPLRYDFIDVTLNGKDLGVYALEEHFEKRVIEHNRFREGPILKFNEELLWADRAEHYRFSDASPTGLQAEVVGNVDAFKMGRTLGDPNLTKQFMLANTMLDGFRYGKLPTHKVFDLRKLAAFFALSDLMGAEHSVVWHNLRFYYNPVTSLLEPIGFDANAGNKIEQIVGSERDLIAPPPKFKDLAFSDVAFFEEYTQALERMSQPAYLDSLFGAIDGELEKKLNIIYSEMPYFHFTKRVFYENQETMRYTLHPADGLHAYYRDAANDHLTLEAGNLLPLPIEILSASFKDSLVFQPAQRLILPAKLPEHVVDYRQFDFDFPRGLVWADSMRNRLKLEYKILGASERRRDEVFSWARENGKLLENDLFRDEPTCAQFKFITVDDSTKRIFIAPGTWKVEQNLVFPSGYRVICGEGTRLDLSNLAKIVSYSPLDWRGSEEQPIVVESTDSTGQGVFLVNAHALSNWEYVTFNNLSNPTQKAWSLTGAVTLYESPAQISYCQFIGNRSEDGVNIIRSEFTMDHVLFMNTKSDAFDTDFAKGKLTNTSFINCGNDAMDVSGTVVELEHILINGTGDKGVSGGEFSHVKADQVEIRHAEIAVASKDKTALLISNVKLDSCGVGFAAYQKKPEFGSATIVARQAQIGQCKAPFLIETNSSMKLDGKAIPAEHEHVESLFYGHEFGKDSKTGRTAQKPQ